MDILFTKKQYIITDYWSSMAQLVPGEVTSEVIKKRFTLKNDNLAKIDQSEIAPINYYWQLRWQIRRKGDLMLPLLELLETWPFVLFPFKKGADSKYFDMYIIFMHILMLCK